MNLEEAIAARFQQQQDDRAATKFTPDDELERLGDRLDDRARRRRRHRRLHGLGGTVVAVALRRQPVEPSAVVTSALTAAEVARLHVLADLFEVDGLNEHTAPYAVVVEVAEVAGGPVEDFTGPGGTPMPLELWSDALLSEVPYSAPVADRLVAAVEHGRHCGTGWPFVLRVR